LKATTPESCDRVQNGPQKDGKGGGRQGSTSPCHKEHVDSPVRSVFASHNILIHSSLLVLDTDTMDKVDLEKTIEVNHFERTISEDSVETANDARINALTPEEQKKLIWKIDCRLVLTLGFMYCVSLMDRFDLPFVPSQSLC
jgi:hypothetical protein